MSSNETNMLFVIDTHVLIWYFIGSKRLHKKLKEKIDAILNRGGRLLVPTIVLAEALDISEKKRVELDFAEMYRLIKEEAGFEIVGFGSEIFDKTLHLKGVKEIHDRIIVATANFYQVGILTKDKIINDSGDVELV